MVLVGILVWLPAWPAAALQYHDVTDAAGVRFQSAGEIHADDPQELDWPAFPEILGGGACWADFDGDGWTDLFLVNHRFNRDNPHVGAWADLLDPRDRLYLNNGDGTFRDGTDRAAIPSRDFGYSCAAADVEGDGDVDLFVGNFGRDRLWINDGGARFSDRTNASGIGAHGLCLGRACVTMSAAWADYDRDDDLDLYVTNYVETNYTDGVRGPSSHIGQHNRLYNNDGTGTFTEVAELVGVAGNPTDEEGSKSFAVVWEDFDGDGDLDIYVTNDMVPNDYYENLGDGTFVERSNETGLADPRAGMGLTTGDFDGDCLPDLFFTHYARQDNGLYRNRGDGTFEDLSGAGHHGPESLWRVGWGTHFLDVDLDGDEDILTTNGHTDWFIGQNVNQTSYAQQVELFRNDAVPGGLPQWVAIHGASGPTFAVDHVGRGLSLADYDLDGDVDFVIVPNANQTASLHRASDAGGHWLRVELRGDGGNTWGIGARLELTVDGVTQCKRVLGGSGFLGQSDVAVTFGLAAAGAVDRLVIRWPSGKVSEFQDLLADRVLRVFEATETMVEDTLSPVTRLLSDKPGGPDWWPQPTTVWFEAADLGVTTVSGVASHEYRIDYGPWSPYTGGSFAFPDEGVTTLTLRAHDHAGNREPERDFHVGRDFTPPSAGHDVSGTAGLAGWWTSPHVGVALHAADGLSGIDRILFRIDGGEWWTYERPLAFTGPGGVYHIEYLAEDRAGNRSPVGAFILRHDPRAPVIDLAAPRASTAYLLGEPLPVTLPTPAALLVAAAHPIAADGGAFTVLVRTTDAQSGLLAQHLARDGDVVAAADQTELSWRWDLSDERPGRHLLHVTARDHAGNVAEAERVVHVVAAPDAHGAPASSDVASEPPLVIGWPAVPLVAFAGIMGLVRRRHP